MLIATVSLSEKDGGKIHSDISVNGQITSTGGTVATASDDQPDFGKITVTNVDSSAFVSATEPPPPPQEPMPPAATHRRASAGAEVQRHVGAVAGLRLLRLRYVGAMSRGSGHVERT